MLLASGWPASRVSLKVSSRQAQNIGIAVIGVLAALLIGFIVYALGEFGSVRSELASVRTDVAVIKERTEALSKSIDSIQAAIGRIESKLNTASASPTGLPPVALSVTDPSAAIQYVNKQNPAATVTVLLTPSNPQGLQALKAYQKKNPSDAAWKTIQMLRYSPDLDK
jgi:hypothetical protein